jgi:hypothetical protein
MTDQQVRSRRVSLPVLALVIAGLALGIGVVMAFGDRNEDPVRPPSASSVEFPLAPEQAATWGVPLFPNPTDSDIVVKSVELIDTVGLSILGMTMTNPDVTGGMGAGLGFPPDGIATFPIEGSVISPRGGPTPRLQVLVGVRLADGRDSGSITAVRVRYVAAGREFEVILPFSLGITLADT